MGEQKYTASLSSGGGGRSGWCVIFRHPIRLGPDGKPGLRIRRGLGTHGKAEAQRLVDQANRILADESLWTPAAKEIAQRSFDARIVAAFYDDIVPNARDGWAMRDAVIPLPSPKSGYARAQLVGTTGAGKTTLLRQFIGTGNKEEKFPSISASKTTTCDIEIVLSEDEEFSAVVSFVSRDQIRQCTEECVCAAILSHLNEEPEEVVARRFLEHSEQRFRLSYLLGTLPSENEDDASDDDLDAMLGDSPPVDDVAFTFEERKAQREKLHAYLDRATRVAELSSSQMAQSLDISLKSASQEDRDTFEELLEDNLREQQEFQSLVDEIMDDIESRFEMAKDGIIERDRGDWPTTWKYRCPASDRGRFIRTVNCFSSNQAALFGRLLTPLVEGIRVKGPFKPSWVRDAVPSLVLMDGEGLGHAANSSTSVSTRITKRYETADVIMLVDSAAQPMLAASGAALRSIVASGQQSKLVIAFTHLDQVSGDNLPNEKAKKQHVLASLDNMSVALGGDLGRGAGNALKRISRERTFFFYNLQEPLSPKPTTRDEKATRAALENMLRSVQEVGKPAAPPTVVPVYDDANLVLCIQRAAQEFREPWRARLGPGVRAEHWTRIKALTRRLGLLGQDEYDSLRPVADLISRLLENIRPFLETPLRWEPIGGTDEMITQAIDCVAREVSKLLHDMAGERLVQKHAVEWQKAYAHRGRGSASTRSREVETIYEDAAPVPGIAAQTSANRFLLEVRLLIRRAIMTGGGKLVGIDDEVGAAQGAG